MWSRNADVFSSLHLSDGIDCRFGTQLFDFTNSEQTYRETEEPLWRLFVVTYVHPDGDGWNKYVTDHVDFLVKLLKEGTLRASGPFKGTPHRSALLILTAANRDEVIEIISKDLFEIQGLVSERTITEWDPIFGAFHKDSSQASS